MLRLLIAKEIRETIISTRFVLTFGACSLLIIFAFFAASREYRLALDEYAASISAASQLQAAGDGSDGYPIFHRPLPLGSLVVGISNDMGRRIEIVPDSQFTIFSATNSRYMENPLFAVFRPMDLEFIFQVVLSLLAILFAHDAISGEKERGTLSLSFANVLPRSQYILGKLLGSFLALVIPLLLPVLIGLLMLPLASISLGGGEWLRLALIVGAGMLYVGVFLNMSIFASALTHHSSHAALLLLAVWIIFVLVVPRVTVQIAGNLVDVPTASEIRQQGLQHARQSFRETAADISNYIRDNAVRPGPRTDPAALRDFNDGLVAYQRDAVREMNEDLASFSARINEDRNNRKSRQASLAFTMARISPAAVFTFVATALGGTSLELKDSYIQQANAYRNSLGDRAATFRFQEDDTAVMITDALPDIALLALFNFVFFCAAFFAFLRYDLR